MGFSVGLSVGFSSGVLALLRVLLFLAQGKSIVRVKLALPGSRPGCVRSTGCFQLLRGGTGGRGYRRLCLGTLSTGSLLQGGILFAGTVLDRVSLLVSV